MPPSNELKEQHDTVLAALDGLLENAEEDALTGSLHDRALDIAALIVVRDLYVTVHDIQE